MPRKNAPTKKEAERSAERVRRLNVLIENYETKRKEKLSQKKLAKMAGVTPVTINRILKGESLFNDLRSITRLADAFGVHLEYFFTTTESAPVLDLNKTCIIYDGDTHSSFVRRAIEVLESVTPEKYAESLTMNITSFHAGVQASKEKTHEIEELKRELKEIKDLIRKDGEASTVPTSQPSTGDREKT